MTAENGLPQRWHQIKSARPSLRLHALVDAAQYQLATGRKLLLQSGAYSLFDGTPDAAARSAGPWLLDCENATSRQLENLARFEAQAPAVVWLICESDTGTLFAGLRANLELRTPDGHSALLRFWDPRVLYHLASVLGPAQRRELLSPALEWHFLYQGRRISLRADETHDHAR